MLLLVMEVTDDKHGNKDKNDNYNNRKNNNNNNNKNDNTAPQVTIRTQTTNKEILILK